MIELDEGGSGRDLVRSPSSARYAAGHLLFVRDNILMTQPFDPDALDFRGDAFPLADNVIVPYQTGAGAFSASDDGVSCTRPESRRRGINCSGSTVTDIL